MATDSQSSTLATKTTSPPSPSSPPNKAPNNEIFAVLESVMRITLAGFGGALAGLSLSRRGNVTGAANIGVTAVRGVRGTTTKEGTRKLSNNPPQGENGMTNRSRPVIRTVPPSSRQFVDRELPAAWSMACMAFAGIIEFTRMVSPTSVVLNTYSLLTMENGAEVRLEEASEVKNENNSGTTVENMENELNLAQSITHDNIAGRSLTKISDYIIGGSLAGALFQGSAVRTRAGARIDASLMGLSSTAAGNARGVLRGKPLSGLVPGAALGLAAGVAIVGVDILQEQVVDYFEGDGQNSTVDEEDGRVVANVEEKDTTIEGEIPEDIKRMSNEELLKSIENLKKGQKEK